MCNLAAVECTSDNDTLLLLLASSCYSPLAFASQLLQYDL